MTRPLRFFVAIVLGFLACRGAFCTDLPFEGDTLGPLEEQSIAVVKVDKAATSLGKEMPGHFEGMGSYHFYFIEAAEVLKGAVKQGQKVGVAFPSALDLAKPADAAGTVMVLGSVDGQPYKEGTVLVVLGGRHGAISSRIDGRVAKMKTYVASKSKAADGRTSDDLFAWASEQLTGDDPFLKRSAAVDLYRRRHDDRAVHALGAALRTTEANSVKATLVLALERSRSVIAAAVIKDVAEDDKLQTPLRQQILHAVERRPEGEAQLRAWATTNEDAFLASGAKASLERAIRSKQLN